MESFLFLIKNFFTHKDFLPPADSLPGTMFTPLHFAFSAVVLALIIWSALLLARKDEKKIRTVFTLIWITVTCLEVVKILWETYSGRTVNPELGGIRAAFSCTPCPSRSGERDASAIWDADTSARWDFWAAPSISSTPPIF